MLIIIKHILSFKMNYHLIAIFINDKYIIDDFDILRMFSVSTYFKDVRLQLIHKLHINSTNHFNNYQALTDVIFYSNELILIKYRENHVYEKFDNCLKSILANENNIYEMFYDIENIIVEKMTEHLSIQHNNKLSVLNLLQNILHLVCYYSIKNNANYVRILMVMYSNIRVDFCKFYKYTHDIRFVLNDPIKKGKVKASIRYV